MDFSVELPMALTPTLVPSPCVPRRIPLQTQESKWACVEGHKEREGVSDSLKGALMVGVVLASKGL